MALLTRVIGSEIGVILIDRIVSQVNKGIIERLQFVLFCGKPTQTVLVDKNTQRLHVCHQNIDSQVELIVVN